MSISTVEDQLGMQKVSEAVAITLKIMRENCRVGMSAKELDDLGGELLKSFGARSAPMLTYNFPGHTCICVNDEVAHGVPSANKIFREGDLINIDVSAELDGFWADNGGSFILGEDIHGHGALVESSKQILKDAIAQIKGGVKIAEIGRLIETQAAKRGFTVIKNLAGHGVGRSLHESPSDILNCYDRYNQERFRKKFGSGHRDVHFYPVDLRPGVRRKMEPEGQQRWLCSTARAYHHRDRRRARYPYHRQRDMGLTYVPMPLSVNRS